MGEKRKQGEGDSTAKKQKREEKVVEAEAEYDGSHDVRGEKRKRVSKKGKKSEKKSEKKTKKDKKLKSKSKEHSDKKVKTTHDPRPSADEFRQQKEIFILKETENIPEPMQTFDEAGFDPAVLKAACGDFAVPTPVQAQCWPVALKGRDLVAIAETGSGKTYAFALPGIQHLQQKPASGNLKLHQPILDFANKAPSFSFLLPFPGKTASSIRNRWLPGANRLNRTIDHVLIRPDKPRIFVLAPTRELAMQTYDSFQTAGKPLSLRSLCLYGGVPKTTQKAEIVAGLDVVVGTVGRVLDFAREDTLMGWDLIFFFFLSFERIKSNRWPLPCQPVEENKGTLDLSEVTYAVLDEADRMLDMGFEDDVKTLLGMCNKKRQTLMFSATWPRAIQDLAARLLRHPLHIRIGRHNQEQNTDSLHANTKIKQIVEVLNDTTPRTKEQRLLELMKKYKASSKNKVLVFALYKKEASRLEELLFKQGYNVVGVHGDKSQYDRTSALDEFRSGEKPIMVATDVAARGLDIPNVQVVLNVTFPLTVEDYVHRIGRTGRAGQTGLAHTLFTAHDKAHAGALARILKDAGQEVPESLGQFGFTSKKKVHKDYGAWYKEVDPNAKSTHITFDSDDE